MVGRMGLVQFIKRLVDNEPVTSDVRPENENQSPELDGWKDDGRPTLSEFGF